VESWVLVDDTCRGWLREELVQVYSNEAQAKTAAETMTEVMDR
jgi:2-C-methyl-D-erythritol 4-phosphate cytidylyltransferase